MKTILTCFYDAKSIGHYEFVPSSTKVTAVFYLGVLGRLLHGVPRIWPEYREDGSWPLLDKNPKIVFYWSTISISENFICQ